MNKYIVGLDIGTTKIACFIGERSQNGKIRILGFGKTESVGVERGVVRNIRDTSDSIRRAVSEASEMAKYDVEEVYVGIAGQHIKSRSNTGSIMVPAEHRQIDVGEPLAGAEQGAGRPEAGRDASEPVDSVAEQCGTARHARNPVAAHSVETP